MLLLAKSAAAFAAPDLDSRYQETTTSAFRTLAGDGRFKVAEASLEALLAKTEESVSQHDRKATVAYIVANRETIRQHIDHPRTPALLQKLLDNYATKLAEELLELAQKEANNYSLGRFRLAFARYHAERGEWQSAIGQLSEIEIGYDLDTLEGDEANIAYGVALQGLKQHRKAVDYYDRVNLDSPYYRIAQLNTAAAYLRQEWWSDAQIAIEKALASTPSRLDETTDRLHTVLGFSQVQYGFYRDARESFRNVRVDSPYASKALLGLGIAALHQEDMVGAINAFTHLKERDADDLSVAESYLLSAFTLDQLGQTRTASAAYTEATAFYQQTLSRCEGLVARIRASDTAPWNAVEEVFPVISPARRAELLELLDKTEMVDALIEARLGSHLAQNLEALHRDLSTALLEKAVEAIEERKRVVQSYLGQANYGLAQLYDSQ